jgi:serine/threonine-protein kinase
MSLGPFRLLERLGRGAQGEVWKARRIGRDPQIVALKVLNRQLMRSPNRLAQFRHEAERGARLAGPSLLRVLEHGEIGGFQFMAMPLVEGTTLQQVIRNRSARLKGGASEPVHRLVFLDEGPYLLAALRIMAEAARAVGRIHSNRVVHRDIKPANILVDSRHGCGAYLCDLGLGRDLEYATPEQMCDGAGTPMYMAPERLLKAPADEMLSDIYSLGATLFEAVTLDRPFRPPELLPISCLSVYLASSRPRHPRSLKPQLPADVEAVVLKAMAREPGQRFGTADDLADALGRLASRWNLRDSRAADHLAHRGVPGRHAERLMRWPLPRAGTA